MGKNFFLSLSFSLCVSNRDEGASSVVGTADVDVFVLVIHQVAGIA